MSSVLPGFEYDIFISYRQKDNKGDGWVTEFVEALKTELEATFKEDISVYFDINPHDGLLETHDVAESLKEKLMALVFIPIVSRTYCDPNSYAWEHEFVAFIEQASQDRFGLKVKLPGGNVASRVLPVRIHDLEPEDIMLAESYLGFIRPVDFIYHSQGVNRPLRQRDDDMAKPGQQMVYRDQINKVANAIKEIISGLKAGQGVAGTRTEATTGQPVQIEKKENKGKALNRFKVKPWLWVTGIAILLIAVTLIAYPKIFKRDAIEQLRASGKISVAVMPFQNLTNDPDKNFWQEMVQNNLITTLSEPEELNVRQPETINSLLRNTDLTNQAPGTPSVASRISQKLDADVFIHGSINQIGTTIRVNANLVDSKTEEVLKSFQIDGTAGNILHDTDSLSGMIRDFLIITVLRKEFSTVFQRFLGSSKSPEAMRNFIDGYKVFSKGDDFPLARELFLKAIGIDSNNTMAVTLLAFACGNSGLYKDAKKWSRKAYENSGNMPKVYNLMTEFAYTSYWGTDNEVIKCLKHLLDIDDQIPGIRYNLGLEYNNINQYEKAIPEFKWELENRNKWGLKPDWVGYYTHLGYAYHQTGQYKKESKLYEMAEKDFPDDPSLIFRQAILALSQGKVKEADKYIEQYKQLLKNQSPPSSDAQVTSSLASIYSEAGMMDKAEELYRMALALEPENRFMMIPLGQFLIDKNRDIEEGIKLLDTVLESYPEGYNSLHWKGRGLYKQGKYLEAREMLQKSWDIRMEKAVYDHAARLHLEEAKKAVQK